MCSNGTCRLSSRRMAFVSKSGWDAADYYHLSGIAQFLPETKNQTAEKGAVIAV